MEDDLHVFRGIVGANNVMTDKDDVSFFNTDWMRALRLTFELGILYSFNIPLSAEARVQ